MSTPKTAPSKKDRPSSAARVFDSGSLTSVFILFLPATIQILERADPT